MVKSKKSRETGLNVMLQDKISKDMVMNRIHFLRLKESTQRGIMMHRLPGVFNVSWRCLSGMTRNGADVD